MPPECGGYGSTKMFIFSNNIYPVPRCSYYISDNMNGNEFMVLKFKQIIYKFFFVFFRNKLTTIKF